MVPGFVAQPHQQHEAAAPLEIQTQIPKHKPYIAEICTKILITLFLLAYMVWSLCMLAIQPSTPKFRIESSTVDFHIDGPDLTAQWAITFLAKPTNHNFNTYYTHIQSGFLYEPLSSSSRPDVSYTLVKLPRQSFVSERGTHSRVEWKFDARKEHVGREIAEEMATSEVVRLTFVFFSPVWFTSRVLSPHHAWVAARCRVDYQFSDERGEVRVGRSRGDECELGFYKNYAVEVVVVFSWVFLAFWMCFYVKRFKAPPARIAPC